MTDFDGELPRGALDALIDMALAEDLASGDLTTQACVGATVQATAEAITRHELVVCGGELFARTFERVDPDAKALKQLAKADPQVLPAVQAALTEVSPWDEPTIEQAYRDVATALDIGLGKVAQPVRAALTGTTAHVGIWEFTSVLDRDEVLERLAIATAG